MHRPTHDATLRPNVARRCGNADALCLGRLRLRASNQFRLRKTGCHVPDKTGVVLAVPGRTRLWYYVTNGTRK